MLPATKPPWEMTHSGGKHDPQKPGAGGLLARRFRCKRSALRWGRSGERTITQSTESETVMDATLPLEETASCVNRVPAKLNPQVHDERVIAVDSSPFYGREWALRDALEGAQKATEPVLRYRSKRNSRCCEKWLFRLSLR